MSTSVLASYKIVVQWSPFSTNSSEQGEIIVIHAMSMMD